MSFLVPSIRSCPLQDVFSSSSGSGDIKKRSRTTLNPKTVDDVVLVFVIMHTFEKSQLIIFHQMQLHVNYAIELSM